MEWTDRTDLRLPLNSRNVRDILDNAGVDTAYKAHEFLRTIMGLIPEEGLYALADEHSYLWQWHVNRINAVVPCPDRKRFTDTHRWNFILKAYARAAREKAVGHRVEWAHEWTMIARAHSTLRELYHDR